LVIARFENKVHAVIDSYFNIPDACTKNRLEIYGTKGSILAERTMGQSSKGEMFAYLEQLPKGYNAKQTREAGQGIKLEAPYINIYQAEIEAFQTAIIKNTTPPVSGEDGVHSMKIIEAIYQASKTKKVIAVKG
jgi:predicted dehydrogenase